MERKARNLRKRLVAVFLFALPLFFAGDILAASGIARFVCVTDPQTISPGKLSENLQIQAQDANGNEVKTEETIDLEFSSTSSTGEFLNASANPVSTVMSKGTANRFFYYRDSHVGVHTLTVKAQGRDSKMSWTVSQTIMIGSAPSPPPSPTPALPTSPTPTVPSGQGVGTPTESVGAAPSSSSVPSSSSEIAPSGKITADAGPDQTATAGSLVEFRGSAVGLKKEPLDMARFWWNFGDGETQEGRSTTHIFRMPGTYIVGLHVSSGEYSASDYATVRVLANQMRVSGVLPGGAGYLRLANPLNVEIEIGGWTIEDASKKQFFIPSRTKIAAGEELSFSNSVTGLLSDDKAYPLTIRYPNETIAITYAPEISSQPITTVSRSVTVSDSTKTGPPQTAPPPAGVTQPHNIPRREKGLASDRSSEASTASESDAITDGKKDDIPAPAESAAVSSRLPISSRLLFGGAIGVSILGAAGFFILKRFLIL